MKDYTIVEVLEDKMLIQPKTYTVGDTGIPHLKILFKYLFGDLTLAGTNLQVRYDLPKGFIIDEYTLQGEEIEFPINSKTFYTPGWIKIFLILKKDADTSITIPGEISLRIRNANISNEEVEPVYDVLIGKIDDHVEQIVSGAVGVSLTTKTEPIPASRIPNNEIPASKLRTASDADKVKLINLSDEVIRAMSGNSPVRPEIGSGEVVTEKIADGAVDYKKLSNAKIGTNIFNPRGLITAVGKYVSNVSGALVDNPVYICTETYIPVESGQAYYTNKGIAHGAFYDINKNFVKADIVIGGSNVSSFTVPEGAVFVRFSRNTTDVDFFKRDFIISKEQNPTYVPFFFAIEDLRINGEAILENSVGSNQIQQHSVDTRHIKPLKLLNDNIFNPNQSFLKGYFFDDNGELASNPNYQISDFMRVQGDSEYVTGFGVLQVAFFDESYKRISAIKQDVSKISFSTPVGTKFIKLVFPTHAEVYESNVVLRKGGVCGRYSIKLENSINNSMGLILHKANLIERSNISLDALLNTANGEVTRHSGRHTTEYIAISPTSTYYAGTFSRLCYYDENLVFIGAYNGGNDLENGVPFMLDSIPKTTKFVRLTTRQNPNLDFFYIGTQNRVVPVDEVLIDELNLPAKEIPGLETVKMKQLEDFDNSGVNLYDDSTKIEGSFVNSVTGLIVANPIYNASDYILVEPNSVYTRTYSHQMAFYDANKAYISGLTGGLTFTTPSNAKYVRVTIHMNETSYMLYKGLDVLGDSGYRLPNLVVSETQLKPSSDRHDIRIKLPKVIHVAVGREIDLYNRNVCSCINIDDYFFEWICPRGKNTIDKYTILPTINDIGSYILTLKVYDSKYNLVTTETASIIVSPETLKSEKTILCIGDSLTNDKPWISEVKALSGDKLTFVGSRGGTNKHEGRSGYSSSGYVTDSGYGFQGNYKIKVLGSLSVEPQVKKQYNLPLTSGQTGKFDVEEIKLEDGATWIYLNRLSGGGDVQPDSVAIGIDMSVAGDNAIHYSEVAITSRNPFWNPATKSVDFSYYSTTYGIQKPDIVQIWLGANETTASSDFELAYVKTMDTTIKNVKIIVDKILSQWSGTKIIMVLNQYWADQSGMGQGYGANSRNEMTMRVGTFAMNKALIDGFEGYHNDLVICSGGLLLDSVYNYPFKEVNINPRNPSIKVRSYTDWVHPSVEGYLQMADAMYSTISYIFN